MNILDCQEAFGAWDKTSKPMRRAVQEWFSLYYRDKPDGREDPCQRIACTVVGKLVRNVFAEYKAASDDPFTRRVLEDLDGHKHTAVQLALVGGESYLKPWINGSGFGFTVIPRNAVLIFARDPRGVPTDMGTMERSAAGRFYYTLLERRTVDQEGYLTLENRLFRSYSATQLGTPVPLASHSLYADLPDRFTFDRPVGGLGLVQLKTPMLNCVDGSADGVSVYAPATGLIHSIDRNEFQLSGEFDRGESRVFVSSDLLDKDRRLADNLFVGLDEDTERVGITVFSPQLREQSFLARKQEYLRNCESVIGLKRGMLSDANVEDRTATEITASAAEHNLTVMDFQAMWEDALRRTVALCAVLGQLYGIPNARQAALTVDWGNGVLYDEEKTWEDYKSMVAQGLMKPELALAWRFNLPAQTSADLDAIRKRYMP